MKVVIVMKSWEMKKQRRQRWLWRQKQKSFVSGFYPVNHMFLFLTYFDIQTCPYCTNLLHSLSENGVKLYKTAKNCHPLHGHTSINDSSHLWSNIYVDSKNAYKTRKVNSMLLDEQWCHVCKIKGWRLDKHWTECSKINIWSKRINAMSCGEIVLWFSEAKTAPWGLTLPIVHTVVGTFVASTLRINASYM